MPKLSDSTIEINLKINEEMGIPHLRDILAKYMKIASIYIANNFQSIIIDPLILGGKGWKPFVETQSWKWLNSPRGYAQMGFSNALEPLKLLNALRSSWKVHPVYQIGESTYVGFTFSLFNIDEIRRQTIHPNAGELKLPSGRSWFDWVYDGIALIESGYHFKKTGPKKGARSSLIAGSEAGLMKTGGLWQVTPRFRVDLDGLIKKNEDKITRTIQYFMQLIVSQESRK